MHACMITTRQIGLWFWGSLGGTDHKRKTIGFAEQHINVLRLLRPAPRPSHAVELALGVHSGCCSHPHQPQPRAPMSPSMRKQHLPCSIHVLMRSEEHLEQQHVRGQSRVTHRSTDGVACDQCANRSIALDASSVITNHIIV
jgi:hypothetical protein